MNMENLKNYYTATSDKEILSIRKVKEIINQIPEDQLDFEMVVVEKLKEELRGIPISNVVLDIDGKQLAIFNFILRNELRAIAASNVDPVDQDTAQKP